MILYYKPTCPFSGRVLSVAEDLGIKLDLRDISSDPVAEAELMERGGKHQTPYFVDPERGAAMYESRNIIEHLFAHFSGETAGTFGGLRIHRSPDACDGCE